MSTNIVAGSVSTDYETAASHTITVRETLAGASNSPRDTVLTINVTDVADTSSWTPLNLGAKLLAYGSVALSVTRTGTDITAVPDLSGNGYHFAASGNPQYGAASYNGGPGATFDGIDDFVQATGVAHGGSNQLAMFISCQVTTGAVNNDRIMALVRNSGGFHDLDADAASFLYVDNTVTDYVQAAIGGTPLGRTNDGAADFFMNTPYRLGSVFDGTTSTCYQNGVAGSTTASASDTFASTATLSLSTKDKGSFNQGCKMIAQSWIFMKTAPSAPELTQIDAWLQNPV